MNSLGLYVVIKLQHVQFKRIEGKGPEERHNCPIYVYFIDGKINVLIDFAAKYSICII